MDSHRSLAARCSVDADVLDRAFARATGDTLLAEEALRHFSRACSTRVESAKRLDDSKPSEIVSLGDMLDRGSEERVERRRVLPAAPPHDDQPLA